MFNLKASGDSQTVLDEPRAVQQPASDWTPTDQQRAIMASVQDSREHLAVNAVAGAAKTTTAVKSACLAGLNCGFVAFNKIIADELRSRLGANARASTMHSLGYRLLSGKFPGIELDERKVQRHFLEHFPDMHEAGKGRWADRMFPRAEYQCVPEMVGICKTSLLDPEKDRGLLLSACDAQGVELPEQECLDDCLRAAGALLNATLDDGEACDFNDMIWMPVALDLVRPQFGTLFVDEAQDLNPAQQELVMHSGERFVIVGDPHQAIYGFAGADCRSFYTLTGRLGECLELPLTVSFRCPASHGELARYLVPHFETSPGAPAGEIIETDAAKATGAMRPGDMVVCRANAPLVSLAYDLIREGKPVLVRGRSIGESLTSLVRRLRCHSLDELEDRLDAWEKRQLRKLEKRDAESGEGQIRDKANCLRCLIDAADDVPDLLRRIETLFSDSDPANRVVLSSIHRAKGLERDRIFLWEPGMMPMSADQQELNLLYVALTRARKELYLVDGSFRRKHGVHEWLGLIAGGATRGSWWPAGGT